MDTIQNLQFSKKDKVDSLIDQYRNKKGMFSPKDAKNILVGNDEKSYKVLGKAYKATRKNVKAASMAAKGYNPPKHQFLNVEQEKAWNDGENIRKRWGTGILGRAIAEVNSRRKYGQSYYSLDKEVQKERTERREKAAESRDKDKKRLKTINEVRAHIYADRQKELSKLKKANEGKKTAIAMKTCRVCGSRIPKDSTTCPYCSGSNPVRIPKPKTSSTQTSTTQSQTQPPTTPQQTPKPPVPPQQTPQQQQTPTTQNGQAGQSGQNGGNNNRRHTGLGPRGSKGSNRPDVSLLGIDLDKKLHEIVGLARSKNPNDAEKAKSEFHKIIANYRLPDDDYKRWRRMQNYYGFGEENFSLPPVNIEEAVKRYKEKSDKAKGILKLSKPETKEEKMNRLNRMLSELKPIAQKTINQKGYNVYSEEGDNDNK